MTDVNSSSKMISKGASGRRADGATLPRVRAVSRAIAIMRAFTPEEQHLPLFRIAEITGLDAGTTRRILVTLRDEGIVAQDSDTGHYSLTIKVMSFAGAVPEERSLKDVSADLLDRLSNEVGATVFLSVFNEDEAVCLARYHGTAPVQVRWWTVDGGLPLNTGAAPRLLLAYQPEDARERILASELTALTPKSIVSGEVLRKDIEAIREAGWSYARDDVAQGLSAIAAPIRDGTGKVVAAVSLGGLTPLIGKPVIGEKPPETLASLLRCCEQISRRLQ
ncbi:MAG: IclR family transcriptional regulator [Rhizobiaceae bacterium]|nr:IclR family transcriptional regulator [Rhizobiaceae bacterium]